MKIGRNLPVTYMDRNFDTGRLFVHSRLLSPKVVLPKKKEAKTNTIKKGDFASIPNEGIGEHRARPV